MFILLFVNINSVQGKGLGVSFKGFYGFGVLELGLLSETRVLIKGVCTPTFVYD